MRVRVNGTRLWFDVVGPALEEGGARMRERPTVILIHGGPGGYDHSYLRPAFDWLASIAQVVYLDLRLHGRSDRGDPNAWTLEACSDDLAAFIDALGIETPIVVGHSLGAMVALLHARAASPAGVPPRDPRRDGPLRRPADRRRLPPNRRRRGRRDRAPRLRRRAGSRGPVGEGPGRVRAERAVPGGPERVLGNDDLAAVGMRALASFDATADLGSIERPTLVCVGSLDPVTPVAAAQEIVAGLRPGVGRLEVLAGVGHWLWLDAPDRVRTLVEAFVLEVSAS